MFRATRGSRLASPEIRRAGRVAALDHPYDWLLRGADHVCNQGQLRLGAKAPRDIASISFGAGLAACLVINLTANRASPSPSGLATAHQAFSAIAQYVLIASMDIVVVIGLIAMMATRGYQDAGGPGSKRYCASGCS